MTKDGLIWIEPSKTTVEGLATLISDLTDRVSTLESKVGAPASPDEGIESSGLFYEVEGLWLATGGYNDRITALEAKEDKDTTYTVKEGDKVLALNGTEFSTALSLAYADNKIKLLGINDEVISEFDASAFVEDGVLEDASYDATTKKITFTWNIVIGKDENGQPIYKTDVIEIDDLVDTYTAGNGIDITGNVVSAKIDSEAEEFLTVGANGIKLAGVQEAINAALAEAKKYADDNDTDTTYTLSGNGVTVTLTPSTGEATTTTLDVYTKSEADTKIDEKIASVTGGESAADVKLALETYRNAINKEIWGDEAGSWTTTTTEDGKTKVVYTPNYGEESRLDKLEAIGAQANVIEEVKASETAKLTATKNGKTVTIDDAALVALIEKAQKDATQGIADAASAASAASAAQGTANQAVSDAAAAQSTADTAKGIADKNKADIAAHATEFSTLKGTVEGHSTAIASKAAQSDLDALSQTVGGHTGKLSTIEGDITAINEAINNRYTKAETDSAIKAITGTPAQGKTLVKMIEDLADEAYDDTEIRNLITDITKAETGAIAVAVKAETDRATDVEKGLDNRLKEVETFFEAVEAPDETINTLAEIISYIESDKSGAAELTGKVNKNTTDIENLTTRVVNAETAISTTLPNAIASAIKETEDYADEKIAAATPLATIVEAEGIKTATKGLILPEVDKFEMAEGKVTKVSTDLLVNGSMTLILNGGNASK